MDKHVNTLPILDVSCALAAMGGDNSVYRQTVSLYLEIVPKLLQTMETAFGRDDRATVRNHAHMIKSSSRTIGGMLLGETAEFLEYQCETARWEAVGSSLDELRRLFGELTALFSSLGYEKNPLPDCCSICSEPASRTVREQNDCSPPRKKSFKGLIISSERSA